MNTRDKFLKLTEGSIIERRVKLREFIFRQNTGVWPTHLTGRRWFENTLPEKTWRHAV
jgi:hypothetical protein